MSKRVLLISDEQALRKTLDMVMEPERSAIVKLIKVIAAQQSVSDFELESAEDVEALQDHAVRRLDADLAYEVIKYATTMQTVDLSA